MQRRVRKQVHDLSAADFEAHSCWAYSSDEEGKAEQDECTVRPLPLDELLSETAQVFVQAAFMFPNGRTRFGMITLNAGEDPSGHQPIVFLDVGAIPFYNGAAEPKSSEVKTFLRRLRKVCTQPFPVTYVSALQSEIGKPLASGQLLGLYWLADWRTDKLEIAH